MFQTKGQTIFEHKHDVIYHGKCTVENCVDDYTGETARRVKERIVDHTGRDTISNLLKHSVESRHKPLEAGDYKIISTGYGKELKPILNKQEKSVPLKLIN